MNEDARHALRYGFGLGGWIPRTVAADAHMNLESKDFSPDEAWMAKALLAAMEGNGPAHPNPCVGALIVKDGQLLAQASTGAFGEKHAEARALQGLDKSQTQGATLYCTLEPCIHQGKQPPCSEAIIAAGIRRCVIAAEDPFPAVAGGGIIQLRAAGIEVIEGCLRREARAWHFPFLAFQTLKQARPVLLGKWAQTLDGHLADDRGISQWISGPRSRAYAHWLRQKYDAVMVGIGTVYADHPSLTVRQSALPHHRHPHKIVYDPFSRLSQATPEILQALASELKAAGPCLFWIVQRRAWKEPNWWGDWKDRSVLVFIEESAPWVDIIQLVSESYQQRFARPLQSILVEGGTQILTQLLRADLLDAWQVFLRTAILGAHAHRIGRLPLRDGDDPKIVNPLRALQDKTDFALLASYQLDDDIVLESIHRRFAYW